MPLAEGILVGRRQELASVEAALDALRSPDTRWVAVTGEPGTGKRACSRVVRGRGRADIS